jgi:hypothetical protein
LVVEPIAECCKNKRIDSLDIYVADFSWPSRLSTEEFTKEWRIEEDQLSMDVEVVSIYIEVEDGGWESPFDAPCQLRTDNTRSSGEQDVRDVQRILLSANSYGTVGRS